MMRLCYCIAVIFFSLIGIDARKMPAKRSVGVRRFFMWERSCASGCTVCGHFISKISFTHIQFLRDVRSQSLLAAEGGFTQLSKEFAHTEYICTQFDFTFAGVLGVSLSAAMEVEFHIGGDNHGVHLSGLFGGG